MSLGDTLNNPGNLEQSSIAYNGEVTPSSNPTFKQFATPELGFRAMTSNLYHYIVSNNLNTITKIINEYAPAADGNNPPAYIATVSSQSGIDPNQVLTKDDFSSSFLGLAEPNMLKIIRSMATVEQGHKPDENNMKQGYDMFISDEGLPS